MWEKRDTPYKRQIADLDAKLLTEALKATRGNRVQAAARLGIDRNTLYKRIRLYGLEV
jgi:two-component system nitrogen regulation response regulator GlnG